MWREIPKEVSERAEFQVKNTKARAIARADFSQRSDSDMFPRQRGGRVANAQ